MRRDLRDFVIGMTITAALVALPSCDKVQDKDVTDRDVFNEMISVGVPVPDERKKSLELESEELNLAGKWNACACEMLVRLYEGDNFVLSPLGLQTAMAMLAEGASTEAQREILSFLDYDGTFSADLSDFCHKYLIGLPALDLETSVNLANALVCNDSYAINPEFKSTVKEKFFASVVNMDFNDEDKVLSTVNDWASYATKGLIPSILKEVNRDAVAYLLNAIYFKGVFMSPFDEKQTSDEIFHATGSRDVVVKMMQSTKYVKYEDEGDYRYISLIVGKHNAFRLTVVLPDDGFELGAALQKVAARGKNFQGEETLVRISLPKFKIESEMVLNDMLGKMGVVEIFKSYNDGLFVNTVKQNASFSLCEKGVEAAAVTYEDIATDIGPGTGPEPEPIEFNADYPFAFYLTENTSDSGLVLFAGVYAGMD